MIERARRRPAELVSFPQEMTTSLPATFGKYILLRPLARGGMGELFLAIAGEMGGFEKLCVIKRVLATNENDGIVRRFQAFSRPSGRAEAEARSGVWRRPRFGGFFF